MTITAVNTAHDDVKAHVVYRSVGEEDAKRAKKEAREEREREEQERAGRGVGVVELWKAHTSGTKSFLEGAGKE